MIFNLPASLWSVSLKYYDDDIVKAWEAGDWEALKRLRAQAEEIYNEEYDEMGSEFDDGPREMALEIAEAHEDRYNR